MKHEAVEHAHTRWAGFSLQHAVQRCDMSQFAAAPLHRYPNAASLLSTSDLT